MILHSYHLTLRWSHQILPQSLHTIQEKEDILDNELLSKFDLLDYDIERTFYRVCMFMKKYRKLKSKNYCEMPIKITSTYKYIFVDERTKGINDYTKLDAFIDNDTEYQTLSKKICSITKHFSQEELIYYTICLYRQASIELYSILPLWKE